MEALKDDLKIYIENLVNKNKTENINPKDIKKLILLVFNNNELEKLSFDKLVQKISHVNSIVMSVYLENRYGGTNLD